MNFAAHKVAHKSNQDELIPALYEDVSLSLVPFETYFSLFKACIKRKSLSLARHLHSHLTHHGLHCDGLLGSFLVVAFAKCGAVDDALYVSRSLSLRTVFSWAAIICALGERGRWEEALDSFRCMKNDGFSPDAIIYTSLLKACGSLVDLTRGRTLHAEAVKKGFTLEFFVGNTLVSMYGKCGAVQDAKVVFCALPQRTIVSWTAMMAVYLEQSQGHHALRAYRQMHVEGAIPNLLTLAFALKACNTLADAEKSLLVQGNICIQKILEIGLALHAYARRKGFACDVVVGTALLCLYGKCGARVEAENVFRAFLLRDIVMWNSMLSAYKDQYQEEQVLLFYQYMQEEGVTPNQLTFVTILEACGNLAKEDQSHAAMARDIGWGLHCDIERIGYTRDVLVGTSLMNMYGKCGAFLDVEAVFNILPLRNIATWTAMLSACMDHGEAEKALSLYSQMQVEDITFDDIIFLAILQLCGEVGWLDMYKQIHFNIVSVGYDRIPFIKATLVHGFGKCASMLNAEAVLSQLSEPTLESWNACIAGHSGIGNLLASIQVFEELRMSGLNPDEATFAAVFSACSHSGLIIDNFQYLRLMNENYGLMPGVKHYVSLADLLGRAGRVREAFEWLKKMSLQADPATWSCLLGACRIHGNIEVAKLAFEHAVRVHQEQIDAYILLSNTCISGNEMSMELSE